MGKIIRKYNLRTFYIITFIVSFLLLPLNFVFQSAGAYSVSFTQFAPALGVFLIALLLKDPTILQDLKNHLILNGTGLKWVIPAVAIPSSCILVTSLILSYFKINFVPWTGDFAFYMLNALAILVGCTAEEIGWRGYLLPNLQKRHTPFISSLTVGVLWGISHLNFTGGGLGFILYNVTIIEMSILMTWLYNRTNGNLLLMIIWHFMFNVTSHVFLWDRFNTYLFITETIVFGLMSLYILIADKKVFLRAPKVLIN